MKRLAIKKLIVISQSESRSLEVPFENGLNIILGGNKTGKSSIIKSIFTTLGCECKRIETDWKKLISAYLLFFKYGEKQFCVVRQGKKFQIFENNIRQFQEQEKHSKTGRKWKETSSRTLAVRKKKASRSRFVSGARSRTV